jgi:hypothetical protein
MRNRLRTVRKHGLTVSERRFCGPQVSVAESAMYEVKARITPRKEAARIQWGLNGATAAVDAPAGAEEVVLGRTRVANGDGRVTAEVASGGETTGVWSVEIRRV